MVEDRAQALVHGSDFGFNSGLWSGFGASSSFPASLVVDATGSSNSNGANDISWKMVWIDRGGGL